MHELVKLPAWIIKNPLGIIALFVSLIYGISALLLGKTIENLTPENQTHLVYFIIAFPCVVLGVFAWLVSYHHTKLYGPSDYRSDKSFIDACAALAPSALGVRLEKELSDDVTEHTQRPTVPVSDKKFCVSSSKAIDSNIVINKQNAMARAYLAESLVFQELQVEFSGSIKRGVALTNDFVVDGVLQTPAETILVEVKVIRFNMEWKRRIREASFQMKKYSHVFHGQSGYTRFIFAVILDSRSEAFAIDVDKMKSFCKENFDFADIRIYDFQTLLRKYGFPTIEEEQ